MLPIFRIRYILIIAYFVSLWAWALYDILCNNFKKNYKIIWIIVVLMIPVFGAILYLMNGRKQKIIKK